MFLLLNLKKTYSDHLCKYCKRRVTKVMLSILQLTCSFKNIHAPEPKCRIVKTGITVEEK